jgi:hypothetical protein
VAHDKHWWLGDGQTDDGSDVQYKSEELSIMGEDENSDSGWGLARATK